MILGIIEYACDQTSKEVSLVALCLTLAYVLRIRTAKYHHPTRFRKFWNTAYLEVNYDENNKNCREKVRNVWRVLSPHGLLKSWPLILLGKQEVEKCNNCTFKLGSLLSPDSDWRETLPQDDLANVSGDEKRNSASKSITFLQEFIEQENDESGNRKLRDDENWRY